MTQVRDVIKEVFMESLDTTGKQLLGELTDKTVLLESGLDSLGFAIVVARLEEELDFDPFSAMQVPVYPKTYQEFVEIYENHANK
jgi:acyl carrier protein